MNRSYIVSRTGFHPYRKDGAYILDCDDPDGYFESYKTNEREAYGDLYDQFWEWRREQAMERDRYMCRQCRSGSALSVDHIKSRGAGGTDSMDNLRTMCCVCHSRRHNG